MLVQSLPTRRSGSVLPLVVISLVALCGFVALAVDVGLIAVARTQCQNAADAAAMVGARSLDGSSNNNVPAATTNARNVALANQVLSQPVQASEVTIQHGTYHYDTATQTFAPQYTVTAPDTYNLTRATVSRADTIAFARVFNLSVFNVSATAVAAHRPRDVSIILDFSGSMNNESDLWNNEAYLGSVNNSPNNNDTVFPQFGHYSDITNARLQNTSSDPRVGKCNITIPVLGVPALVNDYYQHDRGSTPVLAFSSVGYTNLYTPPSGDQYKVVYNTSTMPPTFAKTVQEITGATNAQVTAKTDPPMPNYPAFKGYTQGPGYWGKTFFVWPPDPNTANDWRRRFFLKTGGSYPNFGGPVDDNTLLWDTSGNWLQPSTYYVINYGAILKWIKGTAANSGPNPFPSKLRGSRILYYDQVPDDLPASAYTHSNANSQLTDPNQRFWKEYIDYMIGVWRDPFGSVRTPGSPACSYGPDWTWGTIKISAPVTGYAAAPTTRLHPQDNPKRPRHRFWFGPLTLVQFISDTGLNPGTIHDISMYPAKLGIAGALEDIKNNHPNDLVSMILFNRPHFNGEPTEAGRFSQAQYPLSRDYTGMQNALWFPPNSNTLDVRPWDANGVQTPRAYGDYTANTCTNYGLMLAYNQFSGNAALRSQLLGGWGRKGSQRLVVLETDGMANVAANATFNNLGANNSYYSIGPSDSVTPGGTVSTAVLDAASRVCALETANPPGFATARKPVIVHCVAFGAVFEPTASGTEAANALSLLQQVSTIGGTSFPTSVTDTSHPDYYKLCIGTLDERRDKLRTAFRKIMDDGIAVAMIR